MSDLLAGLRESFEIESKPIRVGGPRVRWIVWRKPDEYDSSACVLALAQPLSVYRELEEQLRQARRLEMLGRLAGGVAHDFNNILTGVLLYCDLMMAGLEPGNCVRKYAEEIRNASMQATGLARQLLNVARPAKPEPKLLSLNKVAEGIQNLLQKLVGEHIAIEWQLDPKLGLIRIDPIQAQQVLLNVVLNARDAMPAGGKIQVKTGNGRIQVLTEPSSAMSDASLPCALFTVTDNGTGMDAATRDHAFDAFFTTKGCKGTGLGLATVHDIVIANGGLIHIDSAPAKETRITVLLPLALEEQRSSEPQETSSFRGGTFSNQKGIMP